MGLSPRTGSVIVIDRLLVCLRPGSSLSLRVVVAYCPSSGSLPNGDSWSLSVGHMTGLGALI